MIADECTLYQINADECILIRVNANEYSLIQMTADKFRWLQMYADVEEKQLKKVPFPLNNALTTLPHPLFGGT